MGEMRIRIDEGLLTKLENLARAHQRTLEEEINERLIASVAPHKESLYEAAVRIAAMTPKGVKQTDSVEILREIRDEE
ncbi:hypothetical protein [Rhizobium tumorigenes]|uniref:hypothetical protein n=1 Tax=Rhizobium tumorigenes TaxID=2041385 RepID=UPI00241E04E4|nr:hypothetical protein [Rhizobium tumorigenes]WFS00458.1 hypothetical protein PR016_15170 [Rhizobium tumorigenes]